MNVFSEFIGFARYALRLSWSEVIDLHMETDSYYRDPSPHETGATRKEDKPPSQSHLQQLMHTCSSYYVHSSSTRLCVHGALLAYTIWVCLHRSQVQYCELSYDSSLLPSYSATGINNTVRRILLGTRESAPPSPQGSQFVYLYQSSEGMQLVLRELPSTLRLVGHMVSGMLLIPLTVYQKESLWGMKIRREEKNGASVQQNRVVHCNAGSATVASIAIMTLSGVSMRWMSVFSSPSTQSAIDFSKALLWFAIPWGIFAPCVVISAKFRRAFPHGVWGSLICKAAVAVPLARMLGGVIQRAMGVHVKLPVDTSRTTSIPVVQAVPGELETGYYASIGAASIIIGAWALLDLVKLGIATWKRYSRSKRSS